MPAYFLWHPIDHISVKLIEKSGKKEIEKYKWTLGDKLLIQECL